MHESLQDEHSHFFCKWFLNFSNLSWLKEQLFQAIFYCTLGPVSCGFNESVIGVIYVLAIYRQCKVTLDAAFICCYKQLFKVFSWEVFLPKNKELHHRCLTWFSYASASVVCFQEGITLV